MRTRTLVVIFIGACAPSPVAAPVPAPVAVATVPEGSVHDDPPPARTCRDVPRDLVARAASQDDHGAHFEISIERPIISLDDDDAARDIASALTGLLNDMKRPFLEFAADVGEGAPEKPSLVIRCETHGPNAWTTSDGVARTRTAWVSFECSSMSMPGAHPALSMRTLTLRFCASGVEPVTLGELCGSGDACRPRLRELALERMSAEDARLGFTGDHAHDWTELLEDAKLEEFVIVPDGLRLHVGNELPHVLKAAGAVDIPREALGGTLALDPWR